MKTLAELIELIIQQPRDTLLLLVSLGAIGLSAFAIHAVLTLTKSRDRG